LTTDRSARLARLVERLGPDLSLRDDRARRIDRARRVQDAWLRGLGAAPVRTPMRPERGR
jgi:hypothetical protein